MDEAVGSSNPSSEGCLFLSVPEDEESDLLYFTVDGSAPFEGVRFVVGILFPSNGGPAPTTTEELLIWLKFNPSAKRVWSVLNHIAKRASVGAEPD